MKTKFTTAIAEELAEDAFLRFFSDVTSGDKYLCGFDSHPDRWNDTWEELLVERDIVATEARLKQIADRFEKKVSKLQGKLDKQWSSRLDKFDKKYCEKQVRDRQ